MRNSIPMLLHSVFGVALVYGALGFTAAPAALAQQATDAKPAAKPISAEEKARREKMGGYRPDRMKNPNLTSIPPRMTETPVEEIPLKDIKVPPGFQVEVWAHGMPGARMMTRGDKGTVFVGTRVPVQALFDYLEAGDRLTEFLDDFPAVNREQAIAALELGHEMLKRNARAS